MHEEFYTETCKIKEGKKKERLKENGYFSLELITSQPLPLKEFPFKFKEIREYIKKTCCENG